MNKPFGNKKYCNINLNNVCSHVYRSLLSSCSQIILITGGLYLAQTDSLRAMDEEPGQSKSTLITPMIPTKFYKDDKHPLTQGLWKEIDLSERLKSIRNYIGQIKNEILSYNINIIKINEADFEKYKKFFQCFDPTLELLPGLNLKDLLNVPDNPQDLIKGFSGAEVKILSCNGTKVAIKQFKDIKAGLTELLHSLVALDINPSPQDIKMARIYDAVICPENRFHIIMEAAETYDIHDCLSMEYSTEAVDACAEYLAAFHIANYYKLKELTNRKKFLDYAAYYSNTLSHHSIEEQAGPVLFSLISRENRTDLEDIKSDNILQLLPKEDQEKFISFLKIIHTRFKENSSEIFRLINSEEGLKANPYFLTINHGDAHRCNFFYNNSANLVNSNGSEIERDSLHRITMIDFASIVETYGDIGDPAGDVGRFLGSLWDWAAQQDYETYEKIFALQTHFLDTYLHKITEDPIFKQKNPEAFKSMFKENCNFYKLRYYRAIFNSESNRKSDDVKLKLLKSWIKENTEESRPLKKATEDSVKKTSEYRPWQPVKGNIIHNISADPTEDFIESIAEGSDGSYLTQLWEKLHRTGTATLSSTAIIAGMGGIGKTTLALEYVHEAINNHAYNLIYWIPSSTEFSLLEAYRQLLFEIVDPKLRSSIKGAGKEYLISLIKQHLPQKGKCFLVYDNVPLDYEDIPAPIFLKGLIPENAHVLVTSRYNQGWEKPLLLDIFLPKESIHYLFKRTGLEKNSENEKLVEELAEKLGNFPLALAHAAHYLKLVGGNNVSEKHFKDYLEGFKKISVDYFEEKKNPLTEENSKITYENLIARTLRMAEAYMGGWQKKPIAALAKKLLEYSAYLNSEAIAEEFFLDFCKDKEELNETLNLLSSLSLIKKVKNVPLFSIHRLEQLVIRNKKESEPMQQAQEPLMKLIPVFNTLFEKNIYTDEQVDALKMCLSHIICLFDHSRHLKVAHLEIEKLQWVGQTLAITWYLDLWARVTHRTRQVEHKLTEEKKYIEYLTNMFIHNDNSTCLKREDIPEWLAQLAHKSSPRIQNALANMYRTGEAVKHDDRKGFYWYKLAADQGNREALFYLGEHYSDGLGVDRDDKKAFECFYKSAKQGMQDAQCNIGNIYLQGLLGIPKNTQKAFKWFNLVAKQGYTIAQCALGMLYANGQGTEKNYEEAFKWLSLAAKQELPEAEYLLGMLYLNGQGTEKNNAEAFKWFSLAAKSRDADPIRFYHATKGMTENDVEAVKKIVKDLEQGHTGAQTMLGKMYFNAIGVGQNNVKGFEWSLKAADQGDADAQAAVGYAYFHGLGTTQDDVKGFEWTHKAAKQEHIGAQALLGATYSIGKGIAQNNIKSFKWSLKAANQKNVDGQAMVGMAYLHGLGVDRDSKKAFGWLSKAAQQGHAQAQNEVGILYSIGQGVPRDYNKAVECYTKAADQENADAQFNLGLMYANGQGVTKDDKKAIEYCTKAAKQGHMQALLRSKVMEWSKHNFVNRSFLEKKTKEKQQKDEMDRILEETLLEFESSMKNPSTNRTPQANRKYENEEDRILEETLLEFEANMRNPSKNSFHDRGPVTFEKVLEWGRHNFIGKTLLEKLLNMVKSVEKPQEDEANHILEETLHEFGLNMKNPVPEIIQPVDKKQRDTADDRFLVETLLEFESNMIKSIPEAIQQAPKNTPLISKPFIGKGKEEMSKTPVNKKNPTAEELHHEHLPTKLELEANLQNEIDQLTAQGNNYISAAIQHEEDGNWELAQHLAEEADKKFVLAEDVKVATQYQQAEIIRSSYTEIGLSSDHKIDSITSSKAEKK